MLHLRRLGPGGENVGHVSWRFLGNWSSTVWGQHPRGITPSQVLAKLCDPKLNPAIVVRPKKSETSGVLGITDK
jgi:hypothetical protein